jgi:hypothetical protein
MDEHNDFFDELAAGDHPLDRHLAAGLRSWRDSVHDATVAPDERLEARFSREPDVSRPAGWRQWMQRPAIAFAASFAAVLVLGAGAFALVARDSGAEDIAATTSSVATLSAVDDESGEITLPSDLTEQTSYGSCVLEELTAWFDSGFAGDQAPRITDACGLPPIPDLGPEAAAFRADLQMWATCIAGELDSVLPDLPSLLNQGHDDLDGFADIEDKCGEPPDPRDYNLKLPFAEFDWENFDPGMFNFEGFDFGDFNLDDLNLENFDIDGLLEKLPGGVLSEDFDIEQWKSDLGDFEFDFDLEGLDFEGFKLDLESCDLADTPELGDIKSLEDLEGIDFKAWLESFDGGSLCGIAGFFNLDDLDLERMLSDFETQFDGLQSLEGLNFEELFGSLLGDGEFDLDRLLEEFAEQDI